MKYNQIFECPMTIRLIFKLFSLIKVKYVNVLNIVCKYAQNIFLNFCFFGNKTWSKPKFIWSISVYLNKQK